MFTLEYFMIVKVRFKIETKHQKKYDSVSDFRKFRENSFKFFQN